MAKTVKGQKSEIKRLKRTLAKEKWELVRAKRLNFELQMLRNRIGQTRKQIKDVCEGRDEFPY